jgi:membrane dipeptidase
VVQLVGVEHVGLGSDMDLEGYDDLRAEELATLRAAYADSYGFREKIDIEGVDHPQRIFDLTEGLIRRRYSDEEILLVLGGNFQRVLGEIWGG